MFTYAVISDEQPSEDALKIVGRICQVLSDKATLHIVPNGELGVHALRNHNGNKYSFFHRSDESGRMINLNPRHGNLSKLAYKLVSGYAALPKEGKDDAMNAMASLIGLEGVDSKKAKFLVTFKARNKETFNALKIASKLSIKIFNLAEKEDQIALVRLIKALSMR